MPARETTAHDPRNDARMDAYWMPFTANRQFKAAPRLLVAADGVHFTGDDGCSVLERLREIATRHGILLIFDEVITGFGRPGTPFAADRFGVVPDLMALAKGLTNGCIPMGAVLASRIVHDALMTGPDTVIELSHGYTYSEHPLAINKVSSSRQLQ